MILGNFLGRFIVNTWKKLAIYLIVLIVSLLTGVFVFDILASYLSLELGITASLVLSIMAVVIYDKFRKKKK